MADLKFQLRAVYLSLLHCSYLSAFDKRHLINEISLVSLLCLLGNYYVINCISKESEDESRPSDQLTVYPKGTGRGGMGV